MRDVLAADSHTCEFHATPLLVCVEITTSGVSAHIQLQIKKIEILFYDDCFHYCYCGTQPLGCHYCRRRHHRQRQCFCKMVHEIPSHGSGPLPLMLSRFCYTLIFFCDGTEKIPPMVVFNCWLFFCCEPGDRRSACIIIITMRIVGVAVAKKYFHIWLLLWLPRINAEQSARQLKNAPQVDLFVLKRIYSPKGREGES